MALKRYKFHVNTSSSCFLCQEVISHVHEDDLNHNSFSLKDIFHYLNIKLNKIPTLSTKPFKLLNRTDVRVSLCDECQETFEEISKLYRKMEVIKMKLDYKFKFIHGKVKSSFDNPENVPQENYLGQMEKNTDHKFLRHSKLVKELRGEILKKCNKKPPNYHPRVILETSCISVIGNATKVDPSTMKDNVTQKQETEDDDGQDIGFDESENSNDDEFNFEKKGCINSSTSKQKFMVRKSTCPTGESENGKETFQASVKLQLKFKSKEPSSNFYKKNTVTGMFQCTKCDKQCKHWPGIYYHYNAYHLQKRYKCKTCKKVYKYERDLCKHVKACQQNLDRRLAKETDPKFKFVCEKCSQRFATERGLYDHRRKVHASADRYSCNLCDRKFQYSTTLKAHKDHVHLGKKFFCRFCKKKFTQITNQQSHEKKCRPKSAIKVENSKEQTEITTD